MAIKRNSLGYKVSIWTGVSILLIWLFSGCPDSVRVFQNAIVIPWIDCFLCLFFWIGSVWGIKKIKALEKAYAEKNINQHISKTG